MYNPILTTKTRNLSEKNDLMAMITCNRMNNLQSKIIVTGIQGVRKILQNENWVIKEFIIYGWRLIIQLFNQRNKDIKWLSNSDMKLLTMLIICILFSGSSTDAPQRWRNVLLIYSAVCPIHIFCFFSSSSTYKRQIKC